jgi:hypothetical protein
MLALRANGCAKAFGLMHNQAFVIETKFDGERIQVESRGAHCPTCNHLVQDAISHKCYRTCVAFVCGIQHQLVLDSD